MLHTLYSGAFPWAFLGYAPLLGEIFQLQPKACYAYDHEPSCNTQLLKDPLLWRVSLTEDSSLIDADWQRSCSCGFARLEDLVMYH